MHEPFRTARRAGAPFGIVGGMLGATPEGKARRMLLRKLESLRFVVDCWGAIPPRPEQVAAMLETLLELQEAGAEAHALSR